jgi:hypothetical protein
VAASASVPVPPPAPPPAGQSYQPPAGVYGQPAGQFGSPSPGGGQYGGAPNPAAGQFGNVANPPGGTYGTPNFGQTYGQPAGDRPPPGQPTGGWPYVQGDAAEPAARKPRKGLIIALIAAAILVVVGVGGYVGWSLTTQGGGFEVGTCVKQDGTGAAVVDCTAEGAYRITSIEDNENGCPDPNQPTLQLSGPVGSRSYACLVPATQS